MHDELRGNVSKICSNNVLNYRTQRCEFYTTAWAIRNEMKWDGETPICKKSRSLLLPVSRDCFTLLILTASICLRTKLNFVKHLRHHDFWHHYQVAKIKIKTDPETLKRCVTLFSPIFFLKHLSVSFNFSILVPFSVLITYLTEFCSLLTVLNLGKHGISFSWYRNKLPRLYIILLLI